MLSESMEFNAVARGGRHEIHGELEPVDDLLTARLWYRVRMGDGSVDIGVMTLVQSSDIVRH